MGKFEDETYHRLKESRSYASGTPQFASWYMNQLNKEQAARDLESGDFNLMKEAERGAPVVKERAAEKEQRIQEHPGRLDPQAVRSPMQSVAPVAHAFTQTAPVALDPIGTGAEALAKKLGASDETALIAGLLGGTIGTAGLLGAGEKLLKRGAAKGAEKLASGAALDMSKGLKSLGPETADDMIRGLEKSHGGGGEAFDLSQLVEGPKQPQVRGRIMRPSESEAHPKLLDLDKMEQDLAKIAKVDPDYLRADRKALETTRGIMAKTRDVAGGEGPGGQFIKNLMEQDNPVYSQHSGGFMGEGGSYTPRTRTTVLDVLHDPSLEATAGHEVGGHHTIRSAVEVAPERADLIKLEKEMIKKIHTEKTQMNFAETNPKAYAPGTIYGNERQVGKEWFNKFMDEGLIQTRRLENAALEERGVRGGADEILDALYKASDIQPYRPAGHPTAEKFGTGQLEHGWDEMMADMMESYVLRPDELDPKARRIMDKAVHGKVQLWDTPKK